MRKEKKNIINSFYSKINLESDNEKEIDIFREYNINEVFSIDDFDLDELVENSI
ncbi:hypothetical protein [Vibrio harveyi]|uniref:hypothetical protein n=1 Tax=Vibrio harveyi TaxID=669 RepID=UPI0023806895|nr:hypothetical protein [Vibrio harveyi]